MKTLSIYSLLLILSFGASAQVKLSGIIQNSENSTILPGATIQLLQTSLGTVSDQNGKFTLSHLEKGTYTLSVSYVGFETYTKQIELIKDLDLEIQLNPASILTDEVIVNATRAGEKSAMTYSTLDQKTIEDSNFGQDLPFLMNMSPSVVVTSDAGAGVGYTGMRIRGSDITRINVTVNGIPINDSESQGVFFVNMPDFASSIDNIQIQRGVGTSTNGAAAFGASVNIQTTTLNKEAYAEVNSAAGSFNTFKNSVKVGTGLINDKFTFDARLSKISSDGYIDRASSDLKSFFLSGGYYGKSTLVKMNVFSGKEKTYQSWNGVSEDMLKTNRTFNKYIYANQTDNYQQDHYQLIVAQDINPKLTFNGALHYTYGRGYYEEYKEDQILEDYQISPVEIDQNITENSIFSPEYSDLIRQRWLDNDFYGFTSSLTYEANDNINLIGGVAWNQYLGRHFGEVIWAQTAGDSELGDHYYDNNSRKEEFNSFIKGNFQLNDRFNIFADVQYRQVNYQGHGQDNDQLPVDFQAQYNFLNPKIGFSLDLTEKQLVYASYSMSNKEPVRGDFVDAPQGNVPKHETLYDLEVGYKFHQKNAYFTANAFWMEYKNQLVLTGELNDVGANIRTNVDRSYRAGLELEGSINITSKLSWGANATLSTNKIKNFTEVIYGIDEDWNTWEQDSEERIDHENTEISFSPNFVGASQISYRPFKQFEATLLSKFVGKQYLDNTSNNKRKIDPYFINDLRLSYSIKTSFMKAIDVAFQVNNLFNVLYESNGYTYSNNVGTNLDNSTLVTNNYYYPQAGTNFMISANLKF
ncbi:TonB-dependent receptor [Xanthovirga aplysinae]|uniref:TonB-dependent receptor n=1 Tax=Xanthovirga aplysinae TaxID=2529853 RepID=UPI0012BB6650|nr:TonB-dependent receptor [Xanthovirga aplysinae]MTI31739.1 TonB-dependent receptor [Xanthovirga aplysinae]